MCISYCPRQGWLYFNHQDCRTADCPWAGEPCQPCNTCIHRRAQRCYLTNRPHPTEGCCQHNIPISLQGNQPVTASMMTLWPTLKAEEQAYAAVLLAEGVHSLTQNGATVLINLDHLALPHIYGKGTEPIPSDEFDWSDWFEEWEEQKI